MQRVSQTVVTLVTIVGCLIQSPPLCRAEEPIEFKTVSLDDFTGGVPEYLSVNNKKYFPINVDIPTIYNFHRDSLGNKFWSSESDVERITQEGTPLQEHGFFKADVSLHVGYDARRNVFFDAPNSDERDMKAALSKGGFRVTEFKRYKIKGFPILIIEAEGPNDRKMRSVYVATRVETNVLFIYYAHRNPWSKWDDEVWTRFKSTLLRKVSST